MDRIDQIRARLLHATDGEWRIVEEDEDICIFSDDTYICQLSYDGLSSTLEHNVAADAVLIANAKSDIRYLLSVIDGITAK